MYDYSNDIRHMKLDVKRLIFHVWSYKCCTLSLSRVGNVIFAAAALSYHHELPGHSSGQVICFAQMIDVVNKYIQRC